MLEVFVVRKIVRMQHCDPGGVVFTPQYFNLFVEVIEDWFREEVGLGFPEMVVTNQTGLPAMRIVARFFKPSRLGDVLEFRLRVKRLRRNNMLVNVEASCENERRCMGDFLHGFAGLSTLSLTDWPAPVRAKLQEYCSPGLVGSEESQK